MKRLSFLTPLIVLMLVAAGCSKSMDEDDSSPPEEGAVAVAAGVSHGSFQHDGLDRTYRLFVPEGIGDGEVAPLVVGLHGGLGSGDQFAENSQFEAEAQEHGFIAVFPDGVERTWNGGNCCGQAASKGIDDVGFLAGLIEELSAALPVDRARVFMTGHSNGGIMSFRFGCERAGVVAAVAPVAGSLEVPNCEQATGVSLLAIHGEADQSHPLEGGQGPRSIAGVDFVSQAASLERWTEGMECSGQPETSVDGAVTKTVWTGCRDGAQAELVVIAGADHPWPGGVGARPAAQARTSEAIDATEEIWAFFAGLE